MFTKKNQMKRIEKKIIIILEMLSLIKNPKSQNWSRVRVLMLSNQQCLKKRCMEMEKNYKLIKNNVKS